MRFSLVLVVTGMAQLGLATYIIKDDYSADNFFNMFTFDTYDDPTHGYVNYVDQAAADSLDLYNVSNGQVTWGVDYTNIASGRGRNSIRLTSKAQYTHGLVILDVAHMPGSICGVWPALPHSGEIDILENVNTASQNQLTMHTGPGCTLANSNCEGGLGCGIKPQSPNSYGTALNNAGGGVYAMEWTALAINIWFFPRGNIPSDISSPNPNPRTWGPATASFMGGEECNIDGHFRNNKIVFDTTFCGDWAGAVWGQDGTCAATGMRCVDFVRETPEVFAEAFWRVNSLRVYQDVDVTRGGSLVKINIPQMGVATREGVNSNQSSAAEQVATETTVVETPSPATASSQRVHWPLPHHHHHTNAYTKQDGTEDKTTVIRRNGLWSKNEKVSRHRHGHVHHS
ncbi:MAG: hypothetical protein Q9200_005097 [Gallowayella weberi]